MLIVDWTFFPLTSEIDRTPSLWYPPYLFYNLQIIFGYDGTKRCSVVYVADVAGQHANLFAMSGRYESLMKLPTQ